MKKLLNRLFKRDPKIIIIAQRGAHIRIEKIGNTQIIFTYIKPYSIIYDKKFTSQA